MAKTKPNDKKARRGAKSALNRVAVHSLKHSTPHESPEVLLSHASAALQQGDIISSAELAKRSLNLLGSDSSDSLPTLNLLGEIHVELGEIDAARQYFLRGAAIDTDGTMAEELGGGAEKFLWLAQLSDEGGVDSVRWYEKGAAALRTQIQALQIREKLDASSELLLEEKQRKLAVTLCGVVEVYMTDLSWEEDAEQKCEALVTEATIVSPEFAEPWQTLANVRISQSRLQDAQAALTRSLGLWKDLPLENPQVPDFPTRVSLARLLMEADMDVEAIEVLERLVGEDDSSVEVWYLGGWGLYIMGEKQKNGEMEAEKGEGDSWRVSWISSRQWLTHCFRLFDQQDYEDERLGEHAKELLTILEGELGGKADDGDEWEDEESDVDEDMADS
jgi:tetratricopeptide (TPR) repeat protein